MIDSFEVERVEIIKARREGETATIWLVNLCFADGSELIVDDKTSYIEAWISALQDGVHVVDTSRAVSPLG